MYRRPPSVGYERDGDRVVVMDLATGAHRGLSAQATVVWDLLLAHGDVARVLDELAARYPVEREVLARDVSALLEELLGSGLLEDVR